MGDGIGRAGWKTRVGLALAVAVVLGMAAAASALALGSASGRSATGALVKLRETPLGRVLVDARGRTLYLFEADQFGRSACYGKCVVARPPLLTGGTPRAGKDVKATLLAATKRKDGKLQVTYQGYPLYFFIQDAKAGQTRGQDLHGFGGGWYVLDRLGRKIEDGRHGGDPAVVETQKTALGPALVDDRGRTLYLCEADKGSRSVCYGKCAVAWPPLLTTGKPQAAMGARKTLLGTSKRKDGTLQVTYRGHPLYYFVGTPGRGRRWGRRSTASAASGTCSTAPAPRSKRPQPQPPPPPPPPPPPRPAMATAPPRPPAAGVTRASVDDPSRWDAAGPGEAGPAGGPRVRAGAPAGQLRPAALTHVRRRCRRGAGALLRMRTAHLRQPRPRASGRLLRPRVPTGPVQAVTALLACAGGSTTHTAPVPISAAGDAIIDTTITLPSTCLAPVILVNPNGITGAYIAVTGWR